MSSLAPVIMLPRPLYPSPTGGECKITALAYGVASLSRGCVIPAQADIQHLFNQVQSDHPPGVRTSRLIEFVNARGWLVGTRLLRIRLDGWSRNRNTACHLVDDRGGFILGYHAMEERHSVWAFGREPRGLRVMDGPEERLIEWEFFQAHANCLLSVDDRLMSIDLLDPGEGF